MGKIEVLRPDGAESEIAGTLARRRPRDAFPSDAIIAVIDNGKPKARQLLGYVAEEVRERLGLGAVEAHVKKSAVLTIDEDAARDIAARSALVITGLGDCAGCSACSLHDSVTFERLGVPATTIISDAFERLFGVFAANLGIAKYLPTVVPHPVATRSDVELRELARQVAETVVSQLTAEGAYFSVAS